MREILFRGKRLDNGEWVYGDLRHWRTGKVGIHCEHTKNTLPVESETVGQYTGLCDKNDKKIFEGDIVSGIFFDVEDGYGVIDWYDGAFRIFNRHVLATFYDNYYGYEFEVIGNLFDNQELVEVDNG